MIFCARLPVVCDQKQTAIMILTKVVAFLFIAYFSHPLNCVQNQHPVVTISGHTRRIELMGSSVFKGADLFCFAISRVIPTCFHLLAFYFFHTHVYTSSIISINESIRFPPCSYLVSITVALGGDQCLIGNPLEV